MAEQRRSEAVPHPFEPEGDSSEFSSSLREVNRKPLEHSLSGS